jgi:hypothetical protein
MQQKTKAKGLDFYLQHVRAGLIESEGRDKSRQLHYHSINYPGISLFNIACFPFSKCFHQDYAGRRAGLIESEGRDNSRQLHYHSINYSGISLFNVT